MLIFRIKFKHKHTVDITIGTFIKTLHTILDFYLIYATTYYTQWLYKILQWRNLKVTKLFLTKYSKVSLPDCHMIP